MKKLFLVSTAVLALTVAPNLTNAQINIFPCGPMPTICATSPCDSYTNLCVSGGTPPYTYLWSPNGQTTLNLSAVCPGQYTLTVTDAIGATKIDSITLTQNIPLTVSCSANPDTIPYGNPNPSQLNSIPAGGTPPYSYVWIPSTGLSSNISSNPYAYPPSSTCYTVTVTDANGCTSSCQICLVVSPTAVNEYENSISLTLSPNPFSAETVLQTDNPFHNVTLTVYNCFGQTVKQLKNISGQTVTFSRDNLASGLYFVRLAEENKIIAVDKLIITDK